MSVSRFTPFVLGNRVTDALGTDVVFFSVKTDSSVVYFDTRQRLVRSEQRFGVLVPQSLRGGLKC